MKSTAKIIYNALKITWLTGRDRSASAGSILTHIFPTSMSDVDQIVAYYNKLHSKGAFAKANEFMAHYDRGFPENPIIKEHLARSCHYISDFGDEAAAWADAYVLSGRDDFAACAIYAWLRADQLRKVDLFLLKFGREQLKNYQLSKALAAFFSRKNDVGKSILHSKNAANCAESNADDYVVYVDALRNFASLTRDEADLSAAHDEIWAGIRLHPTSVDLLWRAFDVGQALGSNLPLDAISRLIELAVAPPYAWQPEPGELIAAGRNKAWIYFNTNDLDGLHAFFKAYPASYRGKPIEDKAFLLELLSKLAMKLREWDRAIGYAKEFDASFPMYSFGKTTLCRAHAAKFDLVRFDRQSAEIADDPTTPAAENGEIAKLAQRLRFLQAPDASGAGRIVLDVTGLGQSLARGGDVGGIERTLAEVALCLFEVWNGPITLVNWKLLPVEVSEADFRRALFQPNGDGINAFLQENLADGEKRFTSCKDDTIVILGSAWQYDPTNSIMQSYKTSGARIVLFVHDLLQIFYRDLVTERGATKFENWIDTALDLADIVLANSDHSRAEIDRFRAEKQKHALVTHKVELGDDFRSLKSRKVTKNNYSAFNAVMEEGTRSGYVLYVSSIFKRKNHGFLIRAWERLRLSYPGECPMLVIVGARGDAMHGLQAAILETNCAGGRAAVLHDITDEQLEKLYEGCLFTVFPSRCEGWGLPIAESLGHGKICVCADATSLPEVGGALADYFKLNDEDEFISVVRSYLLDAEKRASRELQIRQQYRRRHWADTTANIVAHVNNALAAEGRTEFRRIERQPAAGIILVCPSWERRCGIARYTSHVREALVAAGHNVHVVRGIEDCRRLIETGLYKYLLVQHEYGLFDAINTDLLGPDSTDKLLTVMAGYTREYPDLRQAILMHTIDMRRSDFNPQTAAILASDVPLISLSGEATKNTRALFMEHGVEIPPEAGAIARQDASNEKSIKISYFGFLSPFKRVDRFLEACAGVDATVIANFSSNSPEQIAETEAAIERFGVKGSVTYDFLPDEGIIRLLQSGDVVYLPQGPIAYWATTGSARVSLNSNRPVITSPEDQFADMAEGGVFATEATFPDVIRRLQNPHYYSECVARSHRFRTRNAFDVVYSQVLEHLDSGIKRFAPSAGKVDIRDLVTLSPQSCGELLYRVFRMRSPTTEEIDEFSQRPSASQHDMAEIIVAFAERAMREGHEVDINLDAAFANGWLDFRHNRFSAIDSDRLVPAVDLLQLEGDAFYAEAGQAFGNGGHHSLKTTSGTLSLSGKLEILRSVQDDTNGDRPLVDTWGRRTAFLHLTPQVPREVQLSRRVYRLSYFAGFEEPMRAIAVYRSLLKRDPTPDEITSFQELELEAYLDEVREIASSAPYIHLEDDLKTVPLASWVEARDTVSMHLSAEADQTARDLTGDNLALHRRQRLARRFPELML